VLGLQPFCTQYLDLYTIPIYFQVVGMELNLASHAHQGSIRCLASHRELLASSGADEYVNVYSMVNRKEVAVVTPHSGTVTSMTFTPDGTHLISGSQDGGIAIFRCSDWTMMKIWKNAHKKANGEIHFLFDSSICISKKQCF